MRKRDTAAGQPAVTLPGIVTEQDRAIVARRDAGETRRAIREALGVSIGEVQRAEYRCGCDDRGRAMLADCPDSIEGLMWIGELDGNAADRLRFRHYHYEGPELKRLSDAAALGLVYVSRIAGIGPKSLASIDRALSLFGIAWSPIERTPKRLPPKQMTTGAAQDLPSIDPAILAEVVSRVENLERVSGCGNIFESNPARDTFEYVRARLQYLSGYICPAERLSPDHTLRQRCTILEDRIRAKHGRLVLEQVSTGDLETAGNIVCLPGIKLADVLPQNGGAA